MASRKLSDLHPDVQPLAQKFLDKCAAEDIDILVTCTYRSPKEQNALYEQGRTKPGRIVTNAKAGQSKHNHEIAGFPASKAFDVVPLRGGKPVWGTQGDDLTLWTRIGEIGESVGLEWAGRWKRMREFPHLEKDV